MHKHAEAFKLMTYKCQSCMEAEIVWNSRDGVTPMFLGCRSCDRGMMAHIIYSEEQYAPDHKLEPGQRYFADISVKKAKRIAKEKGYSLGEVLQAGDILTEPLKKITGEA